MGLGSKFGVRTIRLGIAIGLRLGSGGEYVFTSVEVYIGFGFRVGVRVSVRV